MNQKREAAAIQKRIVGLEAELSRAEDRKDKRKAEAEAEYSARCNMVRPIIAQLEATLKSIAGKDGKP